MTDQPRAGEARTDPWREEDVLDAVVGHCARTHIDGDDPPWWCDYCAELRRVVSAAFTEQHRQDLATRDAQIAALRLQVEIGFKRRAETAEAEVARLRAALEQQDAAIQSGEVSDGHHTFNELYDYRKAYNALLFNEWARYGLYDVHKSWQHSDGKPCFGGGWFIVVAQTPTGQISNHYKAVDWPLFQCEERERGAMWDGHTPAVALQRMFALSTSVASPAQEEP